MLRHKTNEELARLVKDGVITFDEAVDAVVLRQEIISRRVAQPA